MSKKRFRPLGDVIRMGLVEDGSLLRYIVRAFALKRSVPREHLLLHVCADSYCYLLFCTAVQGSAYGCGPGATNGHRGAGCRHPQRREVRRACRQQAAPTKSTHLRPLRQKLAGIACTCHFPTATSSNICHLSYACCAASCLFNQAVAGSRCSNKRQ